MKAWKIFIPAAIAVMVLCAATLYSTVPYTGELYFNELIAKKLSDTPEKFFPLPNPDPALLQAISNSGKYVFIHSLDETNIDELINQFGTNNIKYQNEYYSVFILYVEPGYVTQINWLSFFGFVASAVLLISYVVFKGLKNLKNGREQRQAIT